MCYFKNLRQSGYLPGLIARLFTQDFGLAPRSSFRIFMPQTFQTLRKRVRKTCILCVLFAHALLADP